MAEPIGSLMPTAYDDDSSLLGDLIDQRNFELQSNINATDTTIPILGNLGDIDFPVYVTFVTTGEIFYCEAAAGDNLSFVSCVRGVRGTLAQSHTATELMFLSLSGQHLNTLRDATIAAQQYLGLVGTDAGKEATPDRNKVYVATDTEKVYVATVEDTWEWSGNRDDHADLDDLTDPDTHTQYHIDSRALTWHNGLAGGHVIDGDSHDHGRDTTLGAGRVQAGVSASRSGTPTYEREIYYETDNGLLYISKGSSQNDWVRITGAPAGGIVALSETDITTLYGGACPPGWSRFTALDDRFARGAPNGTTSPLNTGGSAGTHTHSYTGVAAHTHTVPPVVMITTIDGEHAHNIPVAGSGGGDALQRQAGSDGTDESVGNAGIHLHSMTVPAHPSSATKRSSDNAPGASPVTTGATSNMPSFQEVIFCVKD